MGISNDKFISGWKKKIIKNRWLTVAPDNES